jgi:mRNA interferase MazF
MDMVVRRTEVWLVNLDPIVGSEIGKSLPCVIVSPDEANKYLNTVTAAPLTSTIKTYPSRVHCDFDQRQGQIAIDQIRAIDKNRLIRRLGILEEPTIDRLFETIEAYFRR